MNFSIRLAKKEDINILKVFEQEVIKYERPFAPNLKDDPIQYYNLEYLIESDLSDLIVALDNDEIIGSGYAFIKDSRPYKNPPQFAYLGFMYVKPEYRGKGINGKIIDSLIARAKDKGITEFQLDVYAENDSAIKAYQKRGFRPSLLNMRMNTQE